MNRGAALADLMFFPEVLSSWHFQFDSPISSVLLFSLSCQAEPRGDQGVELIWMNPSVMHRCLPMAVVECDDHGGVFHSLTLSLSEESYNLLVTSTIEMAVVYRSDPGTSANVCLNPPCVLISLCVCVCVRLLRDVHQRGLSRPVSLSESDQWDAVLCALVIDLDFDGQKEVLLGTYGQVPAPFNWRTCHICWLLWLLSLLATTVRVHCAFWSVGTSLLQIPAGDEWAGRAVSAAVEAELQKSSAVRHLLRFDRGRFERAGCPYTEGIAYLTGELNLAQSSVADVGHIYSLLLKTLSFNNNNNKSILLRSANFKVHVCAAYTGVSD